VTSSPEEFGQRAFAAIAAIAAIAKQQ